MILAASEVSTSFDAGSDRTKYAYDPMGRVAQKQLDVDLQFQDTLLLDLQYDELGRTTAITYPDENTIVRYEHEGAYLRRVCEVTDPGDPCAPEDVHYLDDATYDALGRRATLATPTGTRAFTYEATTQRLAQDAFNGPGYDRLLTYGPYDELGNLLTVAGQGEEVDFGASYTYDGRNRVASWSPVAASGGGSFGYDALGNLTSHAGLAQGFDGPAPHAIARRTLPGGGEASYTYDADGNCASEADASGTRHLGYDSGSRLTCVGTSAGSCDLLEVHYDAAGGRIHDKTPAEGGGFDRRTYLDDLYTLRRTSSGALEGSLHILAFGEEIARKRMLPANLRAAPVWVLPWPRSGPVPPWALATVAALALTGVWRWRGRPGGCPRRC